MFTRCREIQPYRSLLFTLRLEADRRRAPDDGRGIEHDTSVVLMQVEVESKSNESPAVRELSSSLDLTGRIVTIDAMHAQHETAR